LPYTGTVMLTSVKDCC